MIFVLFLHQRRFQKINAKSFLMLLYSFNGLSLNAKKTEVVAFSLHSATDHEVMYNLNVPILTSAKCLGYKWCRSLSPKLAIEENIVKARKQFFTLGSSGCFLGSCNPLTAK